MRRDWYERKMKLGPCPACKTRLTTVYTRKDRHSTLTRTEGYAWCPKCRRIFPVASV